MTRHHRRSLRRVIGSVLVTALLLPLGAAATAAPAPLAGAEAGAEVVRVVPVGPERTRVVRADWPSPAEMTQRVPATARSLRLALPASVRDLAVDTAGARHHVAAWFQSGYGATTEGMHMDGWDLVVDLPRVRRLVQGSTALPPTRLQFVVVTETPEAYLEATVGVELVDLPGAAEPFRVSLSELAVRDTRSYDSPLVLVTGPTTLALDGPPGFWSRIDEIGWIDVSRNHRETDLRASAQVGADGARLTLPLPHEVGDGDWVALEAVGPGGETHAVLVRMRIPSPVPVAAYVQQVYADLFDRAPDDTGLRGWVAALQTGAPYGAVADGITYSREFRSGLVEDAYGRYLDRAPDGAGLGAWLDAMDRGLHIQAMEAGFLASDEYYASAGGTDEAWVRSLYADVLGRVAGEAEVRGWVATARALGRVAVPRQVLLSTEHLATVVDGYYRWLLGRAIDPTGRRDWVSAIQAGHRSEEIIAGIIASAEYRANVPVGPPVP